MEPATVCHSAPETYLLWRTDNCSSQHTIAPWHGYAKDIQMGHHLTTRKWTLTDKSGCAWRKLSLSTVPRHTPLSGSFPYVGTWFKFWRKENRQQNSAYLNTIGLVYTDWIQSRPVLEYLHVMTTSLKLQILWPCGSFAIECVLYFRSFNNAFSTAYVTPIRIRTWVNKNYVLGKMCGETYGNRAA
jgi:hypothetical protein